MKQSEVMPFEIRWAAVRDGTHRRVRAPHVMCRGGRPVVATLAGRLHVLIHPTSYQKREIAIRPRIRSIKPEIWQSRDFMALPLIGKLTFFCLISHADDEGRLKTDADHTADAWLHVPSAEVKIGFAALITRKMIEAYVVDDEPCVQVTNWTEHQRIDPRTANASTIASPSGLPTVKTDFTDGVTEPAGADRSGTEGIGRERTGESAREENEPSEETPTAEEAQVVLKIQALGIRLRLRERTTQALETASRKGANNRVAFLLGRPEAGRVCLLEDLAIGWREEDNRDRKEEERMGTVHRIGDILPSVFPPRSA